MSKKGIIILSICALFLFFKYLAQLFPSLIGLQLMHDYHLNAIQLAILASSYYYSYSFMQIIVGYVIDRYEIKYSAFLAISAIALAMLLFTHDSSFLMMCISRVIMGLGASFATVLYMKCAAIWAPVKTFGIISSLLATATMLGAAVGGAPIAFLFNKVGWQEGLNIIASLGIIIALFALFFISNKSDINTKNDIYKIKLSDLKIIILNKTNWQLLFYSGLTFSPIIILGGLWGTPFLIRKFAISVTSASILISTMFIGIAIGSPFFAILALRLKKRKSFMHWGNLIAFLAIVSIIYLNLSYSTNVLLFFILGFAVGSFMLSFQIGRESNPITLLGFAFAFINTGEGIIGSILEPLMGYILDLLKVGNSLSLNNYYVSLSVLPICFILSSLILIFIKTTPSSNKVFK